MVLRKSPRKFSGICCYRIILPEGFVDFFGKISSPKKVLKKKKMSHVFSEISTHSLIVGNEFGCSPTRNGVRANAFSIASAWCRKFGSAESSDAQYRSIFLAASDSRQSEPMSSTSTDACSGGCSKLRRGDDVGDVSPESPPDSARGLKGRARSSAPSTRSSGKTRTMDTSRSKIFLGYVVVLRILNK